MVGLARQEIQNMATATSGRRGLLVILSEAQLVLAGLCFLPVRETKTVKVHLYLTTGLDRDAEIKRLLALGTRRSTSDGPTLGRGWS